MNSFYTEAELKELGLKSFGKSVLLSKKVSIYGAKNISIGNNVRIDDFCILSGKISFGDNIHISAGVLLYGGTTGIELEDYTGIASRSAVYAESDDYSGEFMTSPVISDEYRHIIKGKVKLCKYSIVGTGCTILPGVTIGEGAAVGAMCLINKNLDDWSIYIGLPCKLLRRRRRRRILELEKKFRAE